MRSWNSGAATIHPAARDDSGVRRPTGTTIKLILTVADSDDADVLTDELVAAGYPVAKHGSSGGFLRHGSTAINSGVEDDQVDDVIAISRRLTNARRDFVPVRQIPFQGEPILTQEPIEVQCGGAVIGCCRSSTWNGFS